MTVISIVESTEVRDAIAATAFTSIAYTDFAQSRRNTRGCNLKGSQWHPLNLEVVGVESSRTKHVEVRDKTLL